MKKDKKLINKIDDNAVEIARLATLLQAQADELEAIDDSNGQLTLDNWKHYRNQIGVINNIVMKHLKMISDKSTDLVDNYYSEH